jgi:hypothetical protein
LQNLLWLKIRFVDCLAWETKSNCTCKALLTADKISFKNVLLSIKPDLKKNDLPSSHNLTIYIKNKFTDHIGNLKKVIEVSYKQFHKSYH